jgi:hypothetical protein
MLRAMRLGSYALGLIVGSTFALARASAQDVPPPPAAYATASIGMDLVLEPLASAAEADLARGDAVHALARAQVAMGDAPASSTLHARVEGLALLARQRLGDAPPAVVTIDEVIAPLVDAAAGDVTAGRLDLARARITWVLAHATPGTDVAMRAQSVSQSIDAHAAPVATTTPPPISVPTSAAVWAPPTATQPPPPADPTRRTDAEIVDLYITTGVMGAYFGAWTLVGPDAYRGMDANDAVLATAGVMLVGGGILTLGTFGLDQIDNGPRMGQPAAIATGIRFGLVTSGLTLGILSADHSYSFSEAYTAMGIGLLGGAALGLGLAYGASPHPSQTQFTQASGVWGAVLGAELAALISPLAFPNFGASDDRERAGFGITLGGVSLGIVTGMILAATHEHFSARRSWLTTLGVIAGTGAGSLVWFVAAEAAHGDFDLPRWGAIAGVGSIGGFVIAALLTGGDQGHRGFEDEGPPPVQVSVSPTTGGASFTMNGAF